MFPHYNITSYEYTIDILEIHAKLDAEDIITELRHWTSAYVLM